MVNGQLARGAASTAQRSGSVGEESHRRDAMPSRYPGGGGCAIISFMPGWQKSRDVAVHLQIQSHRKLGGPLAVVELALLDT